MTEQERKLIEQKDFFGNAILYELCADYPLGMGEKDGYTKQDAFSTQSWLIGRAYAASPQRRRYKNLKVEFDGPDGLDGFFIELYYSQSIEFDAFSFSHAVMLYKYGNVEYIIPPKFLDERTPFINVVQMWLKHFTDNKYPKGN